MKKYVSVALAASMIASMGVTAMADTKYDYDVKNIELASTANGFGESNDDDELYYPLWITKGPDAPGYIFDSADDGEVAYDDIEDIDDLKVTIKFTEGSEYVADYYIDEIDNADAPVGLQGAYAVILELNDNYTTKKQRIKGEITIKNKTKKLDERDFSYTHDIVNLTVSENNSGEVNNIPEAEFDGEDVYINLVEFNNGSTYAQEQTKKVYAYTVNGASVFSADGVHFYTDNTCETEAVIPDVDGPRTANGTEHTIEAYSYGSGANTAYTVDGGTTYYGTINEATGALTNDVTTAVTAAGDAAADTSKDVVVKEYDYDKADGSSATVYSINGTDFYESYTDVTGMATAASFVEASVVKGADTGETTTVTTSVTTKSYNVAKFTKDVENIELEDNNGFYFDVKASDQGKLNLAYDNVAIKSVARVAPVDADLTFFNFYGYPEFDFTGTVTLTPEEDDVEYFVYKVDKDGRISKVNAKLNEDGDAYEFKTRTLACYVLSDMELDIDDINADGETPSETPDEGTVAPDEDGKQNPGTGC